jgi:hypothetical protein
VDATGIAVGANGIGDDPPPLPPHAARTDVRNSAVRTAAREVWFIAGMIRALDRRSLGLLWLAQINREGLHIL